MRRTPRLLIWACFGALALALTALAPDGYRTAHADAAARPLSDAWGLWAVPPVEVAAIVIAAALYSARAHRLGPEVPLLNRVYAWSGFLVLLASVCSPLGALAQSGLLTAHMLQHTLIGAVAPLLILAGMPRAFVASALSPAWRQRLASWSHPAAAFPLWVISTVVWLLPPVHHAVLAHQPVWIVQQLSFFLFGALLWAPVLERLPAPDWFGTAAKCVYMSGVWVVGLTTANVYWFSGTVFYPSHAHAAEAWGIDPLTDQGNSGTVMMVVHCLLAFGAMAVLFFRQARESGLQQRLLDAGLDPDLVQRAVRDGAAEELARARGIPVKVRAGID